MPKYMTPFTRNVDLATGTIRDAQEVATRKLSHMKGLYADQTAEEALLREDPLIYQVFEATKNPTEEGQLRYSTTIIRPGRVGNEFFMTKGHYHAKPDRAELYFGLKGEGALLMQTPEGEVHLETMGPGSAAYVPPFWGHRTVNTGEGDFVFLAVYPADAGYDYQTIESDGFARIVVDRDGKVELAPNPRHARA